MSDWNPYAAERYPGSAVAPPTDVRDFGPTGGVDERRQFLVSLSTKPRLSGTGIELLDLADDVGLLEIVDDMLCFHGDRVELTLDRRDIRRSRMTYFGPNGISAILSPDIWLDLEEPVLGRSKVRFGLREGATNFHALPRGRRLVKTLTKWRRGQDQDEAK